MKKVYLLVLVIVSIVLFKPLSFAQVGPEYTVAGGGVSRTEYVPALTADIGISTGIAFDAANNMYIGDMNGKVRMVDAKTGLIHTVAGSPGSGVTEGVPATDAELAVRDIAFDKDGNMYIGDGGMNIWKVDAKTTIVNNIYSGIGYGGQALFVDPDGWVYVAGINTILKVDPVSKYTAAVVTGLTVNVGEMAMDNDRNLYFADYDGDTVFKLDAYTGKVSKIAGGGLIYTDGALATSVALPSLRGLSVDGDGNIFISEWSGAVYRIDASTGKIKMLGGTGAMRLYANPADGKVYFTNESTTVDCFTYAPIAKFNVIDTCKQIVTHICNGTQLKIELSTYHTGMNVITDFGDGTIDNSIINKGVYSGGYSLVTHSYSAAGTYTITQTVYKNSRPVDTFVVPYTYTFCRTLPIQLYYEANGDCVKNPDEHLIAMPSLTEVDSNGIAVDTISATGGFNYDAYCVPGSIYDFKLLSHGDLVAICPASGVLSDTVLSSVPSYSCKYFGLSCSKFSQPDIAVNAVVHSGLLLQWTYIYVSNKTCTSADATVSLYESPRYLALPDYSASVHGNWIEWTVDKLSATDIYPRGLAMLSNLNRAYGYLKPNDTLHRYLQAYAIVSDLDSSDNHCQNVDTVSSSYDPNEMMVMPSGCITNATQPVQLKYTVTFENTGNDTAHNIYVMDTLSDNIDIHSLRIVMASASMETSIQNHNGYNVMRFDFPGINLLDSSHHDACTGTVIYTVNTKAGLPDGASIQNHSGIYFDQNDVVMTNTVENTVGCPILSVPNIVNGKVAVYPIPANDEITIETEADRYNTYTITNTLGQVMLQDEIIATKTKVDISSLAPGVYHVMLKGAQVSAVQKFVKL